MCTESSHAALARPNLCSLGMQALSIFFFATTEAATLNLRAILEKGRGPQQIKDTDSRTHTKPQNNPT